MCSDFETMGEFYNNSSLARDVGQNPMDHALDNSEKSELLELESQSGNGDPGEAGEAVQAYEAAEDAMKAPPASLEILGLNSSQSDNVDQNLIGSTSMMRKEHRRKASEGLQRDESMRKEKEWKRTLACKLYEERITFKPCDERTVVDGGEEMDLLWEAYEDDANRSGDESKKDQENKGKKDERDEATEDEDEQLCCLQALRLSAGKMNLGVGRPNLAKASKVLKGMGLFRSVSRRGSRKK